MAVQTRRWLWIERLLFGGGLVLLLLAVAVLGLNSSSLPTRWAEAAMARALPGVSVSLASVRLVGIGSLEATAVRLDLEGDGRPEVRSDRVIIDFNLFRWLRGGDPVGAVQTVTVRGVDARLQLPAPAASRSPAREASGPAPTAAQAGRQSPAGALLARLPAGLHFRLSDLHLTLADEQGEIARVAGEAELTRQETPGQSILAGSLVLVEELGAQLELDLQVPVDSSAAWTGNLRLAGDLSAPWIGEFLSRLAGWPQDLALAGPVVIEGTVTGRGLAPAVAFTARGGPVALSTGWAEYRFERLTGRARWAGERLAVEALELVDGATTVTAEGVITAAGMDLAFRGERVPLGSYAPFLAGHLDGQAEADGRIEGEWGALRVAGRLVAPGATVMGGQVDRLTATLAWAGGRLELSEAEIRAGDGRIAGSGWWRPDEDGGFLQGDITSEGFALQRLASARALGLAGSVDGRVHLEGPLSDPALKGRIEAARLAAGPAVFENVAGTFGGSWGRVEIEQLSGRRVDGGSYQVTGWVGPRVGGAPAGGAGLDVELYVVDESLPEIASLLGYRFPSYLLAGRFDGRARLGGSLAAPTGSARLELKDSPLLGEELVTQLDLRFGDGAVQVERLRRHPLRSGLDSWVPS